MDLSFLPAVNAALNSVAAVLLVVALVFIKQRKITAHRNTMLAAFGVSMLFLVLYLTHKWWKASQGMGLHTSYNGEGLAKLAYLLILFTHLVLAMAVPVLAVLLIVLGLKRKDALHKRIAKFAWPIWMYVSVTGVVIYFMLYHLNPSG